MKSKSPLDINRTARRCSMTPLANSNLFTFRTFATPTSSNSRIPVKTQQTSKPHNRIARFPSDRIPIAPSRLLRSNTQTLQGDSLYTGKIQNYTLGKNLGQGAYALVKQAICRTSKQIFAIKTYEKSRLVDPQKKKNLIRQIRVLKKINHQNIITLKQAIDSPRHIHIVTEYVGGLSLHSYLKRRPNRQLSDPQTRRLFTQIVGAVSYCHNRQITHRDIKLQNILLDHKSNVKLIDFGFSTCIPNDRAIKLFCGTPSYMAPQIVARKQYTGPPADIWALGVLLFVMLTGTFPFKAGNDRELYRRIQRGIFDVPQHVNPQARLMIKRMMQVDPVKRLTAEQVLAEPWMQGSLNEFNGQKKLNVDILSAIEQQGHSIEEIAREIRKPDSKISRLYSFISESKSSILNKEN